MLTAANKTTQLTAAAIASSYNKAQAGPLWLEMDAIVKSIVQSKDYSPSLFFCFVCLFDFLFFYWEGKENTNQNPGSSQVLFVCTGLSAHALADIFSYHSGRQALLGKKK